VDGNVVTSIKYYKVQGHDLWQGTWDMYKL